MNDLLLCSFKNDRKWTRFVVNSVMFGADDNVISSVHFVEFASWVWSTSNKEIGFYSAKIIIYYPTILQLARITSAKHTRNFTWKWVFTLKLGKNHTVSRRDSSIDFLT